MKPDLNKFKDLKLNDGMTYASGFDYKLGDFTEGCIKGNYNICIGRDRYSRVLVSRKVASILHIGEYLLVNGHKQKAKEFVIQQITKLPDSEFDPDKDDLLSMIQSATSKFSFGLVADNHGICYKYKNKGHSSKKPYQSGFLIPAVDKVKTKIGAV